MCVCLFVRRRGGAEEEREERQRWNQKEQQRIMNSVKGMYNSVEPDYTTLYDYICCTGLARLRQRAMAIQQRQGGGQHQLEEKSDHDVR